MEKSYPIGCKVIINDLALIEELRGATGTVITTRMSAGTLMYVVKFNKNRFDDPSFLHTCYGTDKEGSSYFILERQILAAVLKDQNHVPEDVDISGHTMEEA